MSVAKVIEITADSKVGFEDAVKIGIRKANETVSNIKSAWVASHEVHVEKGEVTGYRVHLKVTFVLK